MTAYPLPQEAPDLLREELRRGIDRDMLLPREYDCPAVWQSGLQSPNGIAE